MTLLGMLYDLSSIGGGEDAKDVYYRVNSIWETRAPSKLPSVWKMGRC